MELIFLVDFNFVNHSNQSKWHRIKKHKSNFFLDPKVTPPPPQDGIDALMNFANNDQGM